MNDSERVWRKFAPPSQVNAFNIAATKYRSRSQRFADEVTEAIERGYSWERWIDKQVKSVLRMRRSRMGGVAYAVLAKLRTSKALSQIPDARTMGHSNWDIQKFINGELPRDEAKDVT